MGLIVPNPQEVFPKYVYYSLLAPNFLATILREGRGANINNLRFTDLENYSLPMPAKDEQQAIVRELDGINRLIDLQEERLREYDRLAQSLFYTTFGDPVSNPKGWEVKKLGEVAVIRDGSHNPPKGVDEPTEYRMLSSQNIFDNLIDYSKGVRYLSKENFELEHKRTNLKAGDVLLTIVGTIGRACIVTDKDTNITLQLLAKNSNMNRAVLLKRVFTLANYPRHRSLFPLLLSSKLLLRRSRLSSSRKHSCASLSKRLAPCLLHACNITLNNNP